MGQAQSGQKFSAGRKEEKRKWEPPIPPTVGKKKKRKGMESSSRLPQIFPVKTCKLKALRLARVHDYVLMEEEFINAFSDSTQKVPAMVEEDRSKVRQLQGMPMQVATLEEMVDDQHAIVSTIGEHYVPVMSFVDKDSIEPGCSVLVHNKTYAVVGVANDDVDPLVGVMKVEKCPLESYADIGGLEEQIQEVKEAVEYPLSHPELYEEIGIRPPKGVIFYGEPGTGKTLLARAVANQTSATFLRVVGSELVQKYLGDGPKLVREIFRVAEENSPSIVFIDEIDAIGTKRYDASSSGEKEIQRTMLELLNQLDGFDAHSEVKVIMATNKIETLDPALIRPGRIDRKVEFPLPDEKTRKVIFDVHTKKMSLDTDVDLTEFILAKDNLSGAEIKAVCTEAGLMALRERRMRVNQKDFDKGREQVMQRKNTGVPQGLYV